jgi:hypothetical protein
LSSAFQKVIPCNNAQSQNPKYGSVSHGLASLLLAALTAGLYPQLAQVSVRPPVDAAANPNKHVCTARTSQGEAQIHQNSVNRYLATNGFVVYHEKVRCRDWGLHGEPIALLDDTDFLDCFFSVALFALDF